MCVCVRACVRACVRVCVFVCACTRARVCVSVCVFIVSAVMLMAIMMMTTKNGDGDPVTQTVLTLTVQWSDITRQSGLFRHHKEKP